MAFDKCARSRDFYAHRCESPLKSTNQVGRFHHKTFRNGGQERGKWPGRSLGMKLKCQIAVIGVKNRPVCPYQSMAKFARDFLVAIKFAAIGV